MNLVQVLPKGRFGKMISFEFHLKNRHEKTQKPLWFPGFQPRYLFRCYLLVAGVGFFIARSKTHSPPFANSFAGSAPCFLPCRAPFFRRRRRSHSKPTPSSFRSFGSARSRRQKEKDASASFSFCIAPPKKILLSDPKGIAGYLPFFQFAAQSSPTLSIAAIVPLLYFFNLWLIPHVPTMPFPKPYL